MCPDKFIGVLLILAQEIQFAFEESDARGFAATGANAIFVAWLKPC
jgi:hypothetical protein